MNFESILADIENGLYKGFKYNPDNDCIGEGYIGRWGEDKGKWCWTDLEIHRDNTIEVKDCQSYVLTLAQLGLGCHLAQSNSIKAPKLYVHRMRDEYLFTPGMRVHLATGVPVDAKLVKDIVVDKDKQKRIQAKVAEFRTVFLAYGRVTKPPLLQVTDSKYPGYEEKGGIRIKYGSDNHYRDPREAKLTLTKILAKSMSLPPLKLKPNVFKELEAFGWEWGTVAKLRETAFNNMLALVKAELYAELGVVC